MELTFKDILSNRSLNCPICNFKASCTCKYRSHIETHTDPLNKAVFKCFFCDQRVTTLVHLREHMFAHRDRSEKLKCFVCNIFCKSEKDFNDHIWLHQSLDKQQTFECMYCDYKARSVNTMKMHMLIHKNFVAVQTCCLCHYKSKSKSDLLRHFVTHKESPNSDMLICGFCEYKTKHLSALRLHLSTHRDEIEVFKCCVCEYVCHSKVDLTKHFLIHKNRSNLSSFKCSLCNYTTSYLEEFRLHLFIHNGSSDTSKFCTCQYNCHLCDYKTKNVLDFQSHLRDSHENFNSTTIEQSEKINNSKKTIHEDNTNTPKYHCDECSFETTLLRSLKRHRDVHKDRSERHLFDCTSCGASFTTKASLKLHTLGHMDPQERPMLHCEWCDHKTMYKSHLTKHIKLKHFKDLEVGLKPTRSNTKKGCDTYKCTECSYETKTFVNFKRHEGVHKDRSERQLYQCAICSSTFTVKKSLKEHILSQHSNPTTALKFQCCSCEFATADKSEMNSHRLEHSTNACTQKEHEKTAEQVQEKEIKLEPEESQTEVGFEDSWEPPIYQCEICSFCTTQQASFIDHQEIHSFKDRSETQSYQCAVSSSTFTTTTMPKFDNENATEQIQEKESIKLEHVVDHDGTETCFAETDGDHSQAVHNEDSRKPQKYQCELCPFGTMYQARFTRHQDVHKDRSERKIFDCTSCGATYTTKTALRKHSLMHMNPEDRVMVHCMWCDYQTIYPSHLKRHAKFKHRTELGLESIESGVVYNCKECSYETKFIVNLRRHAATHRDRSERQLYQCATCSSTFTVKKSLMQHILLQHTNPAALAKPQRNDSECISTNKKGVNSFQEEQNEESLDTMENKERQMESSFQETGNVSQTVNSTGPWTLTTYRCDMCSYSTLQPSSFKRHKEIHKDRSERQLFSCVNCETTFTTKRSLQQHSLLHVDPEQRPMLHCDQCDYKTMYRSTLKGHVKSRHSKEPVPKPETSKSNRLESVWIKNEPDSSLDESEMNNKDLSKPMKYRCDSCPFGTTHLGKLKRHKQTHKERSERSLFFCITCGSNYTTKAALKKHTLLHMDPNERPTLQCERCDYKTIYKCSLKEHLRTKHLIVPVKPPVKPTEEINKIVYKCKECSYETEFFTNLRRHEQTHKNRSERQLYQCATCNTTYTVKRSLKDHILRDHLYPDSKSKFRCDVCQFKSLSKYEIKTHMYVHKEPSSFSVIEGIKIPDEMKRDDVEAEHIWIKDEIDTGVEPDEQ